MNFLLGPEGRVLGQWFGMGFLWDLTDPREWKTGDTRGTCRARAQSVSTEVPTVVESFFTVLTAERLLLGVGPLVTVKRGVVRELLGAEIAAVGLFAQWVSW